MKARLFVLSLFFAVCCVAGHAQPVKPSISIGTHVLTLGMPEPTVLEQLGTDLILRKFPGWREGKFGQVSIRIRLGNSEKN
jgi:hypothetical protein